MKNEYILYTFFHLLLIKTITRFRAEAVHVGEQHDALEFFQILGNDLDEALELCKLPKIVEVVLGGKFADQKICLDCPHR